MDGVRGRLASALGRGDEAPNIALAEAVAAAGDTGAMAELAALTASGTAAERSDAIKVLYEVAARAPALAVPNARCFLALARGRNNRLAWGGLTALAHIATVEREVIAENLAEILDAADAGTVIAKDQAMRILVALAADPAHRAEAMTYLLTRLEEAAPNQFPMYAELVWSTRPDDEMGERFLVILEDRLRGDMAPSKRRRVETLYARVVRWLRPSQ